MQGKNKKSKFDPGELIGYHREMAAKEAKRLSKKTKNKSALKSLTMQSAMIRGLV